MSEGDAESLCVVDWTPVMMNEQIGPVKGQM
jgi:hypothetical protein